MSSNNNVVTMVMDDKNCNDEKKINTSYIKAIINEMHKDQSEHNYVKFGSTYLKYRKVVSEWMIEVYILYVIIYSFNNFIIIILRFVNILIFILLLPMQQLLILIDYNQMKNVHVLNGRCLQLVVYYYHLNTMKVKNMFLI